MKTVILFTIIFFGCLEKRGTQEQTKPVQPRAVDRNALLGIWWSPEMFQSAAFQLKDSTMYYPDTFEEYKYELKGDSLLVHRGDDSVSGSLIVRVTADTFILVTQEIKQIFTRSETQRP